MKNAILIVIIVKLSADFKARKDCCSRGTVQNQFELAGIPLRPHNCKSRMIPRSRGKIDKGHNIVNKLPAIVVYPVVHSQQVFCMESRQVSNCTVGYGSPGDVRGKIDAD